MEKNMKKQSNVW